MDAKDIVISKKLYPGQSVEVTGWIVDADDGLFILGNHFPEDYNYEFRIRIINQNIIYPILKNIARLGGGKSALFYRTIVDGKIYFDPYGVVAEKILVEENRESGVYKAVDIRDDIVKGYVSEHGNYKFMRPRDPMRDWLAGR